MSLLNYQNHDPFLEKTPPNIILEGLQRRLNIMDIVAGNTYRSLIMSGQVARNEMAPVRTDAEFAQADASEFPSQPSALDAAPQPIAAPEAYVNDTVTQLSQTYHDGVTVDKPAANALRYPSGNEAAVADALSRVAQIHIEAERTRGVN